MVESPKNLRLEGVKTPIIDDFVKNILIDYVPLVLLVSSALLGAAPLIVGILSVGSMGYYLNRVIQSSKEVPYPPSVEDASHIPQNKAFYDFSDPLAAEVSTHFQDRLNTEKTNQRSR